VSRAVPNLLDGQDTDRIQDEVGTEIRKTFAKSRKLTLPVQDITIPNDYRPLDYDKFKELLPDFETRGVKERIEVHERGSRYILLHGRLRLEGAKRLGLDEIKAIVFSDEYYKPKAEPRKKPRTPLPDELELVRKARKGDEGARNKLIDHYYWLAVSRAYKHRRKMEREEASGVAFDAIDKAIATWDPKKAKLTTWIDQKVRGELTTHRRELRKQTRELTWIEPKPWVHRDRKNTKVIPIAENVVRIERLDDPSIYITAKVQKRKRGIDRLDAVVWQEREDEERARRNQARADLRLDTLAGLLTERPHFELWLKRRKYVNTQDQTIAKMLFLETHKVEWVEQIGRKRYLCGVWDTNWLPNEVCEELGITRSKLDAAVKRICKEVTGFTDKSLIALDDVKRAGCDERIRAIPVPEPTLPRFMRKTLATIGREPTVAEAKKAVSDYWRGLVGNKGDRTGIWSTAWGMGGEDRSISAYRGPGEMVLRHVATNSDLFRGRIVQEVADAIRGKTGPDYVRLSQCIDVLKRRG
jgi:hypothetical protein